MAAGLGLLAVFAAILGQTTSMNAGTIKSLCPFGVQEISLVVAK